MPRPHYFKKRTARHDWIITCAPTSLTFDIYPQRDNTAPHDYALNYQKIDTLSIPLPALFFGTILGFIEKALGGGR